MPSPIIDAVLFDADGVLQRSTIDWRSRLAAFSGAADPATADRTAEEFVLDVMASEGPSLVGKGDFADALAQVLERWGSTTTVEDVLDLWRQFEAVPEVVSLIQDLRAAGIECHLATNQQAYRRRIMHDERNYGEWFDQTFYSCDLGVAKPDPVYFGTILETIGRPAGSVLFIDDNEVNVEGARLVGLHAELYEVEAGTDVLRDLLRRYDLPTAS
ncbi:MAG TPA: HAD-IA family hydrolase [Kribbella sp.]|nr:HAD-IA family hydrolase [Kribbella sp.]